MMKILDTLADLVDEEMEDAKNYAELALKCKDSDPVLAKTFYDLSTDELRHMTLLQDAATRKMEEQAKNGVDISADHVLHDYLREKRIKHVAEIKNLQSMYRGT